ncbi:two-component sensor histidine kinase [Bdellovibrio bacteriovorus]|uniref:histidine kinase n=1 Tax=Bdellovibrio bacteriovorus TaxID=959 RepID=A0A150WNE2_BDEBC|nr:ATP-binding protein [Bdellovibrio bacteriovorus]KYG66011.1 two-component sensor histidine kinase [Bdellovibrio bacteriovorus]
MKAKLIAVLVVIAAVFIGAVLWRTDSFVYGDRMSWVEAQTRTQLGSIQKSLATELKSLQRLVATFNADNFQKNKINWNSLSPYYAAASFSVSGTTLEPQMVLVKENSKAAAWTGEFVKAAIGNLDARGADLKYFVKPFQDSQRGRYVALVFIEGNRAYALFGSGEIFQSLIDSQRGSLSSFSIVTNNGLTVGHSVPEYLGTVMRDDPVFKEAQSAGATHGSNTFNLSSGEIFGMYESIPQSNLLVISSAPLQETMKGRTGLWWQFLLMGCGLVAVGTAAVVWVITPAEKRIEDLEAQVAAPRPAIMAASLPPVVKEKVIAPDPEIAKKEKMQASMKVASALAHEMSGPLASILGYTQTILAQSPSSDVTQSADSIIREARSARGVLDKLLGYAGEKSQEKNSLKLEGPLVKSLKAMDATFSMKGVKINKNIQETRALDLDVDGVIRALNNIFNNAVEAMERMPKKEITVNLFEDHQGVHLEIQDIGEGIDAANVQKVFDPFFTTRSFQNHMGLGLSVAFGILKQHHAEVSLESQRGQGTKVNILFKPSVQTTLAAPVAKKEPEAVLMSVDLPQLKVESVHREEAETAFAEVKATTPEVSPVDVNIESLLELPEAAPEITQDTSKMSFVEEEPIEPMKPVNLVTPPPTVDDATVVLAAPPKTSKLDSYHVEIRRPGKRI